VGDEPGVDASHWGFAGTRLLTGQVHLRVVFTGGETLYGEIVRSAVQGAHARTPLQQAIQKLVSLLLAAAVAICLMLAFTRILQGHGWLDALLSAVTLAAAAIPEEFPVVFTFFLGVGAYRLARRQALVRRAVAVENIGRVTTICSDKTGTITEGRLRLTHLVPASGLSDGDLLRTAALACRPESGDPMDEAILSEAAATGSLDAVETLACFPFTEARKRETGIVRDRDRTITAVAKGATETIFEMSALPVTDREDWHAQVAALAAEGHKVVACSSRRLDPPWSGKEIEDGYTLAGLVAFEDPVRLGVAEAIRVCREADIHPIMVTGDHPLTARAIAREIGLGGDAPRLISGDEVAALIARGESRSLLQIDVVARAAPGQKLMLVRALQEAGEIVAVTGDGVNDVPALQAADVGVAMGERGTRSAREVAAIVLLDDNFRTIVSAIREGRQLFRNLKASFEYLLLFHIPFVLSALVVPLFGYPLLYLPVHIVWLELIVHPTALLAFQESSTEELRPTRSGELARFFSRSEWALIGLTGGWMALVVTAGYVWNVEERGSVEHGRAMAIATLAFGSAALAASLSGLRTRAARVIAASTAISTVVFVQTPALAGVLHLDPLHLADWGVAVASSLIAAIVLWTFARWMGTLRPEWLRPQRPRLAGRDASAGER
jgi:Ca2+-transporting ATPase